MIKRSVAAAMVLAFLTLATSLTGDPGAAELLVGRVHRSFQPTNGKVFVLVIGNDARSGNPLHSRADAIHVVGINTKTKEGGILNIPRDSWVSIPGSGPGKINEALYRGGPELLARTIEQITNIRLDYWVMVGFEDFRHIVRALGGVRMDLEHSVHDPTGSGARLSAGRQKLGAHQALAYLRTRHSFMGGDIARTSNQGRFILATLRKLRAETGRSPAALLRWISITRRYARTDLPAGEMFRLGVIAAHVRPRDVTSITVPVSIGSVGAASVVFISPSARAIYERFRETAAL